MFGILKKAFNHTIGKVANTIGQGLGGMLQAFGLKDLVGGLAPMLAKIPGFGTLYGGLLKMIPELLDGELDLEDAVKLGALFLPPPAAAVSSMGDLTGLVEGVVSQVGGVDPESPGGSNLLHLAQMLAFDIAGSETF